MGMLLLLNGSSSSDSLLLDSFPNAAFAYSLNKLRSNYNGSCLRIRRSSDNQEIDIGFSGKQVDLSAIASFCGASAGSVVTWYDQTTNNINATQPTANSQPQIYNATGLSAGQVYNASNKPAISFFDSSAATVGQNLQIDPWYSSTESFVSYFLSFDVDTGQNTPLIGSSPHQYGLTVYMEGSVSNSNSITAFVRRTNFYFGTGSSTVNDLANVCHASANRSRVQIYLNTDDPAYLDIADGNQNFNMPTKIYIGNSQQTVNITGRIRIGDVIGFKTDTSATQKAIRQSIYNSWVTS